MTFAQFDSVSPFFYEPIKIKLFVVSGQQKRSKHDAFQDF